MADVDPDKVYPPRIKPSDIWWVFRTTIKTKSDTAETTMLAYSPLNFYLYPSKALAEAYMKDKTALLKPTEVKVVAGPCSREEAFGWCALNPYVYDSPIAKAG